MQRSPYNTGLLEQGVAEEEVKEKLKTQETTQGTCRGR